MRINDAIEIFLINQKLRGNSPKTIISYKAFLERFSLYLENKSLKQVTRTDINNYQVTMMDYVNNGNFKVISSQTYLRHLKAFFKLLLQRSTNTR